MGKLCHKRTGSENVNQLSMELSLNNCCKYDLKANNKAILKRQAIVYEII